MRSSPRGVENLLLRCSLCRDQILELLLLTLELSEREIRRAGLECRQLLRALLHEWKTYFSDAACAAIRSSSSSF